MYELLPFVIFFTFWNIFWARFAFYVRRDMKFLFNPAVSVVGIAMPIYVCIDLVDDLIFGMICAIVCVVLPYSFWFVRLQFGCLPERPRRRRSSRSSIGYNVRRSSGRRSSTSSRLSDASRDAQLVLVRPGGGDTVGSNNNSERRRSSVTFSIPPSDLVAGENGEFLIPNSYLDQLEDYESNENHNGDPETVNRQHDQQQQRLGGRRRSSSRRRRSLIPKERLEELIICKKVIDEHNTINDEHNGETATMKSSLTSNSGNNTINNDDDDIENIAKDDIEQQLPSDSPDRIHKEEETEERKGEKVVAGKRPLYKHHPKSDIVLIRNTLEDDGDEVQHTNQSNQSTKENNNTNLFPIPSDVNTTKSENNQMTIEINHDDNDDIHVGDEEVEGEEENIYERNTLFHEQLKTCTICMEPYQVGDEIAWSHNEECQHVFHKNCIVEWLTYDTNCPLCKKNFYELRVQFQLDDNNSD